MDVSFRPASVRASRTSSNEACPELRAWRTRKARSAGESRESGRASARGPGTYRGGALLGGRDGDGDGGQVWLHALRGLPVRIGLARPRVVRGAAGGRSRAFLGLGRLGDERGEAHEENCKRVSARASVHCSSKYMRNIYLREWNGLGRCRRAVSPIFADAAFCCLGLAEVEKKKTTCC